MCRNRPYLLAHLLVLLFHSKRSATAPFREIHLLVGWLSGQPQITFQGLIKVGGVGTHVLRGALPFFSCTNGLTTTSGLSSASGQWYWVLGAKLWPWYQLYPLTGTMDTWFWVRRITQALELVWFISWWPVSHPGFKAISRATTVPKATLSRGSEAPRV